MKQQLKFFYSLDGAAREIALTWLALSSAAFALTMLFGSTAASAALYLVYQALFVALPGACLVLMSSKRQLTPIEFTAKAIIVGQCLEMSAGLLFTVASMQWAYTFLPLLYSAVAWLRRNQLVPLIAPSSDRPATLLTCCAAALFLVFAASLFNFNLIVDQHFTWVAAFANSVTGKWPPIEPFLMDVPLHYHYLYNVHVGMAATTMDIPIILVASRLAIVFHSLSFILCLFAFSSSRFGMGIAGVIASVSMLLTFGYSGVMWKIYHLATASIMYRVASTLVAFQIFIFLLDEILSPRRFRMSTLLLCLLIFVGSGTRAMMLPMLAAGVGLLGFVNIKDRAMVWDYAKLLVMIVAGIVAGTVVFLGLGGGHSDGTKLVLIHPLNLAVSQWKDGHVSPLAQGLLNWGVPAWGASLVYLLVALCGRMTFVLPGFVYAIFTKTVDRDVKVLLGGVALGGIAFLMMVETVVPQEIWAFYWYADISLALLGAFGLNAMFRARLKDHSRAAMIGLSLSGVLFVAQAVEFSIGFVPKFLHTNFPTPTPIFQDASFHNVEQKLGEVINRGDVLVTGGSFQSFDERPLAGSVPGLQLYSSRYILAVYAKRTKLDPRVASRLWLLDNDLSAGGDRDKVRDEVGTSRSLYFLWIGASDPSDTRGLSRIASWTGMSLWKVD